MGLEALHDDAQGLAAADPELAKFLFGILKGALR